MTTNGEDDERSGIAERVAQLSDIAAAAGIVDVAEGAEILAASGDVSATSALVGLMSEGDLEIGLELARTAGELWTVGDVVELLEMPVLAEFLEGRGESMQSLAVEAILRAAGARALSQVLGQKAGELEDLGVQEVAEGLVRSAAAEELDERSQELARAGTRLANRAVAESEFADAAAAAGSESARDLVEEEVAQDLSLEDVVQAAAEESAVESAAEAYAESGTPDPSKVTGAAALAHDLSYVEGIGPFYSGKLREAGVDTPQALLDRGATPKGRKELADATGISEHLILKWVDEVDLYRIKGLGSEYSELLKAAGVDTVPELAQRNPEHLYAKVIEVNEQYRHVRHVPSQSQIEDWVRQAKELPRVVSY